MDPWSYTATNTGNYPYLFLFLSHFLSKSRTLFLYSILSIYLCLSIYLYLSYLIAQDQYSLVLSNEQKKKKKENFIIHRHRSSGFGAETTRAFI